MDKNSNPPYSSCKYWYNQKLILENFVVAIFSIHRSWKNSKYDQSRINIGSDGTLARAPVWMRLKRGPQVIFWDPYPKFLYPALNTIDKSLTKRIINCNIVHIVMRRLSNLREKSDLPQWLFLLIVFPLTHFFLWRGLL